MTLPSGLSKCYELICPLLQKGILDPCDAFLLGVLLTNKGMDYFEPGLKLVGKLQKMKKGMGIGQAELNLIYDLLIEKDYETVWTDSPERQKRRWRPSRERRKWIRK